MSEKKKRNVYSAYANLVLFSTSIKFYTSLSNIRLKKIMNRICIREKRLGHPKEQILFLLMFQNKSFVGKIDMMLQKRFHTIVYILQKWHTRRQRRGVLFFQPQYCLYVILKLKDSKVIKFVLLTPKKPNFLYSTFCSKSGLWKLESPVYHF